MNKTLQPRKVIECVPVRYWSRNEILSADGSVIQILIYLIEGAERLSFGRGRCGISAIVLQRRTWGKASEQCFVVCQLFGLGCLARTRVLAGEAPWRFRRSRALWLTNGYAIV